MSPTSLPAIYRTSHVSRPAIRRPSIAHSSHFTTALDGTQVLGARRNRRGYRLTTRVGQGEGVGCLIGELLQVPRGTGPR